MFGEAHGGELIGYVHHGVTITFTCLRVSVKKLIYRFYLPHNKKDIDGKIKAKPRRNEISVHPLDLQDQVKHKVEIPEAAPPWIIKTNFSSIHIQPRPAGSTIILNRELSISLKDNYFVFRLTYLCVCNDFIWRPGERL
ncbi:unnamed protein product [Cochlearia groenlandica]